MEQSAYDKMKQLLKRNDENIRMKMKAKEESRVRYCLRLRRLMRESVRSYGSYVLYVYRRSFARDDTHTQVMRNFVIPRPCLAQQSLFHGADKSCRTPCPFPA